MLCKSSNHAGYRNVQGEHSPLRFWTNPQGFGVKTLKLPTSNSEKKPYSTLQNGLLAPSTARVVAGLFTKTPFVHGMLGLFCNFIAFFNTQTECDLFGDTQFLLSRQYCTKFGQFRPILAKILAIAMPTNVQKRVFLQTKKLSIRQLSA